MTLIYCMICILLAHLIAMAIGSGKHSSGKQYIQDFIAGYAVVIIINLIYIIIK